MIKIFDAAETDFSYAGNIIIEPLKCKEFKKKSLNGWYIEVEVPIKYKEFIEEDKLVVVQTKSKIRPQAFRITKNLQISTRKIKFTANHVMFDAERYFLLDVRPTNLNGINGLNYINERTDKTSPFTFYSNVENINTAYFKSKNLFEALEAFEERWQGVFDADNWDISFMQSVGHDNGESIIYGKNAQAVEIYEDWSNVITRIYPVGFDGIMLPEVYIDSDVQYEVPYTRKIDFETSLEEENKTYDNLITELRKNAQKYLNENKTPKISYTVKSDINDNMEIGDTIQILHPLISIKTEVIEYEYDSILKKVKSLTFGNYSRDIKSKFNNIKNSINQISQSLSRQEVIIAHQTELINTLNKNGYVYIDENEILILDKLPKEDAENVWRFGLGGLGFSSNGYEGPFETAITMDGQINANFITTGLLSVSRIEGLSSALNGMNVAIQLNKDNIQSLVERYGDTLETTISHEGVGILYFENINESEPLYIRLYPRGEDISHLYPRPNLFPSPTLFPHGRTIRFINTTTNKITNYELPADILYYDENNYDEFILDYSKHTCTVIKKVAVNTTTGEKYLLETPQTITYDYPTIQLENGNYTVRVMNSAQAYLNVKLMIQNAYTDKFATKIEMNTKIEQTERTIAFGVNEKLSNYSNTEEMNSAINMKADEISEEVTKKVNGEDFGTLVEQNYEHVKYAWNQISEFIQFEIINGTPAIALKNDLKKLLMVLNKTGQHFYDNSGNVIGDIGIVTENNKNYLSFQLPLGYDENLRNGMAWGLKTPNGFVPIFELEGYRIPSQSDAIGGRMNIRADLNLGTNTLTIGNTDITGDTSTNAVDVNNIDIFNSSTSDGNNFINITNKTAFTEKYINILNIIEMYLNSSNIYYTLKFGEVMLTTDGGVFGYIHDYSREEKKKNFKKYENALKEIMETDIYEYNLKTEKNGSKKHIGIVIGDNYKYSSKITTLDDKGEEIGVETYSMVSVLWKAVQEQQEQIEQLQKEIKELKEEK